MDYLEIRELYHHGIKGQRWGIRRFQNEDGTLTQEGKDRYVTVERMHYERNKDAKARGRAIGAATGAVSSILATMALDDDGLTALLFAPLTAMGGAAIGAGLGHIGGSVINKANTKRYNNKINENLVKQSIDKIQQQIEKESQKPQSNN